MPKDFGGVMKEFHAGKLHSGSKHGPVVIDRKQAIAIAISEHKQLTGKEPAASESVHGRGKHGSRVLKP